VNDSLSEILDQHKHGPECYRRDVYAVVVDCPFARPEVQKMLGDLHAALDRQFIGPIKDMHSTLDSLIGTRVVGCDPSGRAGHITHAVMNQDGEITFTVTMGEA
jgi:hypothetical protein